MPESRKYNGHLKHRVAKIVARASSLSERQDTTTFRTRVRDTAEEIVRGRVDRLSEAVTGSDTSAFNRWLQWSGLDLVSVRGVVKEVDLVDATVLPSWGEILCEIIEARPLSITYKRQEDRLPMEQFQPCVSPTGQIQMNSIHSHKVPDSPIPFQEILVPALGVARDRLVGSLGVSTDASSLTLISSGAYASLERSLLFRLSYIAAPTLGAEFAKARPVGASFLISINAGESGVMEASPTKHYSAFVDHMLADGLLYLFERYPVLARFVAVAIEQWVDATVEFLDRLNHDLIQIDQVFRTARESKDARSEVKATLGLVTTIDPSLSDAHNGGRSTIALTFESGLKLMYKPKSLGLERTYVDILHWCNRNGLSLKLMTHKVLDCDTHGWTQFVTFTPCEDEEAVARFYRGAGMQLCLLYALGASDCHSENLIACGEHLVLVDMETLLSSKPPPITIEEEPGYFDSVLRTGLLPSWECRFDTQFSLDVSGLGFVESQPFLDRKWVHVNTDMMHLKWAAKPAGRLANIPLLGTTPQKPSKYLGDLVDGFEEMYAFILSRRDALLGPNGPIAGMKDQPMRFVFRPTMVYLSILEQALAPSCLRSGIDLSIQLSKLSRAFVAANEKPAAWPLLEAELEAVEQLDVPHFGLMTDDTSLTQGVAEPVSDYFERSGLDECVSRIQRMSHRDMLLQSELIRGAVYCGIADLHAGSTDSVSNEHANKTGGHHTRESIVQNGDSLVRAACSIAEEIQRRSVQIRDDNIDWLGLAYSPKANRMNVNVLGPNLFDGRCGVAIFLAACAVIAGEPRFRTLALRALRPLRESLRAGKRILVDGFGRDIGIGGATGLGSIIYSLVTVGRLLDDKSLIADAFLGAECVNISEIKQDNAFDVINGAAGAALSLLALYTESGDSGILRLATTCGMQLLQLRPGELESAPRTLDSAVLRNPGIAHGSAGITYSLLRLYEVTHDNEFRQAAEELLDIELGKNQSERKERYKAIPDPLMGSWCNGIPGIGLARLGSLSTPSNSTVEDQIEETVHITESWPIEGVDHMCCGNFGRIETLLVASDRLGRPRLRSVAQEMASWVVERARRKHAYQLQGQSFGAPYFDPSFFQGASGIGYGLLRVAHPKTLPCILLWE